VSSTVPLWAALLLGIAPAVVALGAIIASEVRDRRRLKHEQDMQEREIGERRWSTLREERRTRR
jgi:hypothetical protein